MRNVKINVSKEYLAWIGEGLLSRAGEMIKAACGGSIAAIVTDDIVGRLYGDIVKRSLRAAGYTTISFVFPNGERSKNMETYVSLLDALTDANLTRADVVVALGGGVVGDMAGFAAASYLRGVAFAQIPTTLLAMVDSSVGGKTAVNLAAGKNQVGAFYQPDIVLCDYTVLETLPPDVFQDGCAEIIKHGVILSDELFELLKMPIKPQLEDIIARNITIKRDVVVADERDTGVRQILNFGHTIGHGIEKLSGYNISHGKAVAVGMAIVARGAWRKGLCNEDCYREIIKVLKLYGFACETSFLPEQLFMAAFSDKKRSGKYITEILPERIGKCVLHSFSLQELEEFIRLGMQEG